MKNTVANDFFWPLKGCWDTLYSFLIGLRRIDPVIRFMIVLGTFISGHTVLAFDISIRPINKDKSTINLEIHCRFNLSPASHFTTLKTELDPNGNSLVTIPAETKCVLIFVNKFYYPVVFIPDTASFYELQLADESGILRIANAFQPTEALTNYLGQVESKLALYGVSLNELLNTGRYSYEKYTTSHRRLLGILDSCIQAEPQSGFSLQRKAYLNFRKTLCDPAATAKVASIAGNEWELFAKELMVSQEILKKYNQNPNQLMSLAVGDNLEGILTLDFLHRINKLSEEHLAQVKKIGQLAVDQTLEEGYMAHLAARILTTRDKELVFELPGVDGEKISTAAFKGKFVLIGFWAMWCKPCKKQFPALQLIAEKYKSELEVLSISVDGDFSLAQSYFQNNKYKWHFASDPFQESTRSLVEIFVYPTFLLLDRSGRLTNGVVPMPNDGFEAYFEKLLSRP